MHPAQALVLEQVREPDMAADTVVAVVPGIVVDISCSLPVADTRAVPGIPRLILHHNSGKL